MSRSPAPGFTGSPLIRIDHERENSAFFDAQLLSLSARLLRLTGLLPSIESDGRLAWGSPAEADPDAEFALLGLIDGKPCFVSLAPVTDGGAQRSAALMMALDLMLPEEAATYAIARNLIDWHARHPFCPRCGSRTRVFRSGWGRLCDRATGGCGAEHFPRTDPVVIMLAEHGDRILVGRQASWAPGRYSALAGFVEVGESIEEAVARELEEEAGVVARSVRYVVSQPWPFPSQLMIACIAKVESDSLKLQAAEIEDAIWVTRDDVRAALAHDPAARFGAPPPYAIANTLLTHWVNGEA